MIRSLWTASAGMQSQASNIDVISNNLANVNTTGFKGSRAEFQDLLYETIRPAGTASSVGTTVPAGIQFGHGSRLVAVQKLFLQGGMNSSQNELDMAIEGNGFFQIMQPNGDVAYTRDGSFHLDSEGKIVNSDGYSLEPEITVPSGTVSVSIGIDGTVSALTSGASEPTQVGSIQLAKFLNPAGLKSIGRNLYASTTASGTVVTGAPDSDGIGTIAQGFLERSNVNVVDEMVNMITAQRAYEINSKSIQAADDMLQMANQLKR